MKLYAFLNSSCNKKLASETHVGLLKDSIGYANGYVAVPPGHRLHGLDDDKANEYISIHGGLTFAEARTDLNEETFRDDIECINFERFEEIPADYWVFGFDTMHYGDGNKDRDWCIRETKDLLKQLQEL
jgi:hypothetical protein